MPLHLTDEQRGRLSKVLLGAYLKPESFANAIWLKTGIRLEDEFSLNRGRKDVVNDAIKLAEGQDWLEQLVRAAAYGAPLAAPLKDFAASVELAPLPLPPPAPPPLASLTDGALEEIIRRRQPLIPMKLFLQRLLAISRTVCWIGLRDDREENPQFGSGFLVGPDLLLTNHHVVDRIARGKVERGAVVFRFDRLSTRGSAGGLSAGLAEGWCLDAAPPAPSDTQTDGPEPTDDELDYALVRLDSEVGRAPLGADGSERGWLRLAAKPPPLLQNDALYVVQHPAEPMDLEEGAQRIAQGVVLGFDHRSLRVRYDTATTGGSSGSPAFTAELQPAALHQGSEPLFDSRGQRVAPRRTYNRGIPLRPILKRMRAKGVPQFWETLD